MMASQSNHSNSSANKTQDEDLQETYGDLGADAAEMPELRYAQREFSPWHHPVKQVVREQQWAHLTDRLLKQRPKGAPQRPLRYFTLPGADLMDVRVLSDVCLPHGVKISYFGFNSAAASAGDGSETQKSPKPSRASWIAAESSLLQSSRITQDAVIYADRLEDIAIPQSQAAAKLAEQGVLN